MSDTDRFKKAHRKARNKGLPSNVFLGSSLHKGQCRDVAAEVKCIERRRVRAKGKASLIKEII